MPSDFIKKIFKLNDKASFEKLAIKLFLYQSANNPIYKKYISSIGVNPEKISSLNNIPFLPIRFFKTNKVLCSGLKTSKVFRSSGTTSSIRSSNYITDLSLYEKSILTSFKNIYGNPDYYRILALMPSDVENKDSSLSYMLNFLIKESRNNESGFYNDKTEKLSELLTRKDNKKTIIFGLSYALLDFTFGKSFSLKNTIIIETGGMKGRRKELLRKELHIELCKSFGVEKIHSEYGMSELLSQSWSTGAGIFQSPSWKKIFIRDPYDPFSWQAPYQSGGINIIDLANVHSCAFIETEDIGISHMNDSFEILGRLDNSEIRGCNLMENGH